MELTWFEEIFEEYYMKKSSTLLIHLEKTHIIKC